MIADWNTNKIYLSGKLVEKFPLTYKKLIEQLGAFGYIPKTLQNIFDIWARNFMPIQIAENKI
jgi:agmatine deiminase